MEQRALLASALVLGCVTAAGAGGYLAMRQNEPAADTASQAAPEGAQPPVEGTVAEIDVTHAPCGTLAAPVSPHLRSQTTSSSARARSHRRRRQRLPARHRSAGGAYHASAVVIGASNTTAGPSAPECSAFRGALDSAAASAASRPGVAVAASDAGEQRSDRQLAVARLRQR